VVPRQRPPTAKGFVSITMQDKDGPNSVTVKPDTYGRYYKVLRSFFLLVVEAPWRASRLQRAGPRLFPPSRHPRPRNDIVSAHLPFRLLYRLPPQKLIRVDRHFRRKDRGPWKQEPRCCPRQPKGRPCQLHQDIAERHSVEIQCVYGSE
jgi:hypothetical protein